jgi:hypothetical protein
MLAEGVGVSIGLAFELLLGRSLSYLTYYVGREDLNAQARMILNAKIPAMAMVVGDALSYSERNLWDRIIFTQNALSETALSRFTDEERLIIGLALYGPYLELDTILSLVWSGGWKVIAAMIGTTIALTLDSPAWDEFERISNSAGWSGAVDRNVRAVTVQEQILVSRLRDADGALGTVLADTAYRGALASADVLFSSVMDLAAGLLPWVSPEDLNPSRPNYELEGSHEGGTMEWEHDEFEFPDVDYTGPTLPQTFSKAGFGDLESIEKAVTAAVDIAAPLLGPAAGLIAGAVNDRGPLAGVVPTLPGSSEIHIPVPRTDFPTNSSDAEMDFTNDDRLSLNYVEEHDDELVDSSLFIEEYGKGFLYQVKPGDNFTRVLRSHYGEFNRRLGLMVANHPLNDYIQKTDKYGYENVLGQEGPMFTPKYSGFGTYYRSGSEQPMLWLPEVQ